MPKENPSTRRKVLVEGKEKREEDGEMLRHISSSVSILWCLLIFFLEVWVICITADNNNNNICKERSWCTQTHMTTEEGSSPMSAFVIGGCVVVLVLWLCDFVVREAGVLLLEFWGCVILWSTEGLRCAFCWGFFLGSCDSFCG
jgi:hypothetical protein